MEYLTIRDRKYRALSNADFQCRYRIIGGPGWPDFFPEGRTPLVAGGKQFVPASTSRFRRSEPAYFYTEIYEPLLAGSGAPSLTLGYRIVERNTGIVKADTGMAGIGGFVQPGNPVVPFGTTLLFGELLPGGYRLEVRAAHSSGPEVVARTVNFDLD